MKKLIPAMLALACLCAAAEEKVVTFRFTGTIAYASGLVVVGEQVTGKFSYDTRLKPWSLYKKDGMAFFSIPGTFPVTAQVGNVTVSTNQVAAQVYDDIGGNGMDLFSIGGSNPIVNGVQYANGDSFGITLGPTPNAGTAIEGLRLPEDLDLSKFNGIPQLAHGALNYNGGVIFYFLIDSLEKVPN
jgi:hypothetical protein